jgi:sulfur-carrier protein
MTLTVTVLYFAGLREALGINREVIELPAAVSTVAALVEHLSARGATWQDALLTNKAKGLRCAVNQEVCSFDTELSNGVEIAFFPPVTGG